jgi:hypothetical protein
MTPNKRWKLQILHLWTTGAQLLLVVPGESVFSSIRFLRVDNAKEFTCPAMVDLCNANNIILQVVVSYKHLMQKKVASAFVNNTLCRFSCRACTSPFLTSCSHGFSAHAKLFVVLKRR